MPAAAQEEILRAYFDPKKGHGYTLCRTHFNSCDFSTSNYAYDEKAGDVALKHFSIARDKKALIPMIKRAQELSGGKLKLFSSPWSPPAWMKTNGEMNHGGKLKAKYRQAWADYYVRYIREYQKEGIDIWGLTVQNEPAATQVWDSCIYSGEEERDFVRDYLGPTLEKSGLSNIRLMIWDHNRDIMYDRAKAVYDDPAAARFVWGTAFHWYGQDCFDNVQRCHDAWPDKQLLFSEGCQEQGPHFGDWAVGERYGKSVINDLNRWTVAWTDWNLILDMEGGPNHVRNLCSAPIHADSKTGKVTYNNSYYYLGHFSRFIKRGAKRVICASTRDALEATALLNVDGTVAVVVMNRSDAEMPLALRFAGGAADTLAPAHSIATYCFDAKK
jgi:glucosylceramidase